MNDYSNHPKSISEVKGDKTGLAEDWQPRDVLINILRQIDSGEIAPTALVVSWDDKRNGKCGWSASSPDNITTLGLLAHTMQRCADHD